MSEEDLQLLLQIVRQCPSPMLVAAAAAAGLAILILWKRKAGGKTMVWLGQEKDVGSTMQGGAP